MDDALEEYPPSTWRPIQRVDGSIEISVNVYSPELCRIVFSSLTLDDYITAWEEKRLAFQRGDGKPKPNSLPTPEEIYAYVNEGIVPDAEEAGVVAEESSDVEETIEAAVPLPQPRQSKKPSIWVEHSKPTGIVNRRRRKFDEKFAILEAVAKELRTEERNRLRVETGVEPPEDHVQIAVGELLARSAVQLEMGLHGVRSFFDRVPRATRHQWLYGPRGRKRLRSTITFEILMRVREELRKKGGEKPRKKELVEAAAGPLGMTMRSASSYVYERLTTEQVEALDLRASAPTQEEKVGLLLKVLEWMKKGKYPHPRMMDLAREAAPYLTMKPLSTFVLIRSLFNEEKRRELGLIDSMSGAFIGVTPEVVREGLLGAFAVLRLKQRRPTLKNLCTVLILVPNTVQHYLDQHPDIAAMVEPDNSS